MPKVCMHKAGEDTKEEKDFMFSYFHNGKGKQSASEDAFNNLKNIQQ